MSLPLFLATSDLDELVRIRSELGPMLPEPGGPVSKVLDDWSDVQAVGNLLMYPDLIPADDRVSALIRGLRDPDSYLRLAAAVGVSVVADIERADLRSLVDAVLDLISDDPGMPAVRAAAGISGLATLADAPDLVILLRHPDPAVRHNLAAALALLLGGASIADLLADRDEVTAEDAADATGILLEDGIDIHCPAADLRLLPKLPYVPNRSEWSAGAG